MKPSLKDFPISFRSFKQHSYDCVKWKRDFEAALRQKLVDLKEAYDAVPIPSVAGPKIRVKMLTIKEILGE